MFWVLISIAPVCDFNKDPHCMFLWKLYSKLPPNLIQQKFNGSNPDGLFTMDESNTFLNRRDFLQIRYTDYLGIFSSFILQMYAVCTH